MAKKKESFPPKIGKVGSFIITMEMFACQLKNCPPPPPLGSKGAPQLGSEDPFFALRIPLYKKGFMGPEQDSARTGTQCHLVPHKL